MWRFDPKVKDASIPYTAACRGVSYYEQPATPILADAALADAAADLALPEPPPSATRSAAPGSRPACWARIIEGTLDGRIIAVDADSGRPCANFGNNGQVDITLGMGEVPPGYVDHLATGHRARVIVTGHQVLDGQRRDAPSGVIQAYDAITGKLRWAWDMDQPERSGRRRMSDHTRGTPNMWTTATGDEALGLVYLPLGNSAGDYWSGSRTENQNRYATSLVAINVATGKPAWHFQAVRKDVGLRPGFAGQPDRLPDGGKVPALPADQAG